MRKYCQTVSLFSGEVFLPSLSSEGHVQMLKIEPVNKRRKRVKDDDEAQLFTKHYSKFPKMGLLLYG